GATRAAERADTSAAAPDVAYHGLEPTPARQRPSFVLRDTAGAAYDFGQRTRGRPTLLFFGYTSCPDECPTAMADVAAALRTVEPSLREQVEVVFVTTDPDRDTPAVLRDWLAPFGARVVGLRGSQAEVDAAQQAVGLQPARPDGVAPTLPGKPDQHEHRPGTVPHSHAEPLGYAVAHADVIFAYDAADRLPVMYPSGVTPADIAVDLPFLARPDQQPRRQEDS
ncbi:MAG: SCO family protein, partial [Actinomycetota bacterium]|nr:SCO family protein [Actinomycetota bacterium]